MGRLEVTVVEARNLPDIQTIGTIDPYVKLKVETNTAASKVVPSQTSPTWNEVFKFNVADENSAQLVVEVWNYNVASDDFLGAYSVGLSGLVKGEVKDEWYLLQQCRSNAEIHLRLLAVDFGRVLPTAACQAAPLAEAAPQPQAYPMQQQVAPATGAQAYPAQPFAPPQPAYLPPPQPYVAPPPEKPQGVVPTATYGAPAPGAYSGPNYGQPAVGSPAPSAYGQNSAHYQPGANPQWVGSAQVVPPPVAQPVQGKPVGPSRTGLSGFLNGMVSAANTAIDSVHKAVRAQTEGQKRQASHRAIYVNDADGFHFLLADNALRHIPDANVFGALFNRPMDAAGVIHFSTAPGSPPVPYPFGRPLPPFCRLIHFNGEFYMVDDLGGGPPCRRHLNQGAWNQFNLVAGSNVRSATLEEFQHLIFGPPLV